MIRVVRLVPRRATGRRRRWSRWNPRWRSLWSNGDPHGRTEYLGHSQTCSRKRLLCLHWFGGPLLASLQLRLPLQEPYSTPTNGYILSIVSSVSLAWLYRTGQVQDDNEYWESLFVTAVLTIKITVLKSRFVSLYHSEGNYPNECILTYLECNVVSDEIISFDCNGGAPVGAKLFSVLTHCVGSVVPLQNCAVPSSTDQCDVWFRRRH